MKIGYARISTDEKSLASQRDALTAAGRAEVFEVRGVSGVATNRLGLDAALARIGTGDALVVWKLARLGRSPPHLIETLRQPAWRRLIDALACLPRRRPKPLAGTGCTAADTRAAGQGDSYGRH